MWQRGLTITISARGVSLDSIGYRDDQEKRHCRCLPDTWKEGLRLRPITMANCASSGSSAISSRSLHESDVGLGHDSSRLAEVGSLWTEVDLMTDI